MALKSYLLRGLFRKCNNPHTTVHALRGIDLDIHEGERLGIVGHNGSGKSTLLKVIAGVYPPTSGQCLVDGDISSLFDFTLGFEPLANGRDNILYRAYLQGETPKSIGGKIEEIAEFSELGEFLDTPVRFYSSGMIVRLGFSIATAIEPEVLLVDECLGAGDLAFQNKARNRMEAMFDKARVIVMVSHDLGSLAKFCDRIIWMDHGRIRMDGPTDLVLQRYEEEMTGDRHDSPAVMPGGMRIAS